MKDTNQSSLEDCTNHAKLVVLNIFYQPSEVKINRCEITNSLKHIVSLNSLSVRYTRSCEQAQQRRENFKLVKISIHHIDHG